MKPIYLFILSLAPSLIVSQEINLNTPSEITLEFIKDFKKWNDFAYNLSLNNNDDELIESEYKKIITKYCQENKVYQGIAFGSHSDHCPEKEKISKEIIKKNTAIIKTKFRDPKNSFQDAEYEYHFIKIENKWFLEEVYLVDKDGKYEGL
ncbi:RhsIA family immunity protein [Flavobacterium lacisediminis]|uniref:RhsIA family immunity protein n=1 Tax=Flavobacterium lacisediminis TaxID=2989705 RepID=A0ABT3EJN6_9FLAO|nr:RhsIA family immunity protein [Flavobacterium lacisediminis]MCW1148785.1 RhsIA family immunity protein [Flavobacterium lacisediminis]